MGVYHRRLRIAMNKEQVFLELQDVVNTLFSDNIHNGTIKAKWRLKAELNAEHVKELNSCDLLWLSEQYSEWHAINVKPKIDTDLIDKIDGEDFPWI
jgi:hypothetical protein